MDPSIEPEDDAPREAEQAGERGDLQAGERALGEQGDGHRDDGPVDAHEKVGTVSASCMRMPNHFSCRA